MRRLIAFGAALFAPIVLNFAGVAAASDLAGQWIVRWQNNPKNENALSLAISQGKLSGTYTNDSKDTCKVTGNIRGQTRELALTIVCPKWDIRMQGIASADWNSASGNYQAYVDNKGIFEIIDACMIMRARAV
jgi:hypothetical protein